jgi:hypothetical protein
MASAADFAARETYRKLMLEIKVRVSTINALLFDQRGIPSAHVREFLALQIRMICETIGLGCLVVHGDLVEKLPANFRKTYAPGEIFAALDNLHDDFFPVPIQPQKAATGWHMADYEGAAHIAKPEIRLVWSRCGDLLHRGSLKSLAAEGRPVQKNFDDLTEWKQKIQNLLINHRIIRADRKISFIAMLQVDGIGGGVHVAMAGATPDKD